MTPDQYKAALKKLKLSHHQAAAWLGIAHRTSQRYALGEGPIPLATAKLLRLCIRLNLSPFDIK